MYKTETGPGYYKEIPLSEILAVNTNKQTIDTDHTFEIRTANVDYFVGVTEVPDGAGAKSTDDPNYLLSWETAIKQALMPHSQTVPTQTVCRGKEVPNKMCIYLVYIVLCITGRGVETKMSQQNMCPLLEKRHFNWCIIPIALLHLYSLFQP